MLIHIDKEYMNYKDKNQRKVKDIHIKCTEGVHDKLKKISLVTGKSISDHINDHISQLIEKHNSYLETFK